MDGLELQVPRAIEMTGVRKVGESSASKTEGRRDVERIGRVENCEYSKKREREGERQNVVKGWLGLRRCACVLVSSPAWTHHESARLRK